MIRQPIGVFRVHGSQHGEGAGMTIGGQMVRKMLRAIVAMMRADFVATCIITTPFGCGRTYCRTYWPD